MVVLVIALLAGLPLAVWLDLRDISNRSLHRQASDLNAAMTGIRDFYGTNVVGRVLAGGGRTIVTDHYHTIPGAIPIPATFSLELGRVVSTNQSNIEYRFVSDFPFRHRAPHQLDGFERAALASLRADPHQIVTADDWSGLRDRVRYIAPILMGPTCVACHNTHPDSPKRDWKVGDVRGIQELSISEPLATNIFSFRWLLLYFVVAAAAGIAFIQAQRRQSLAIAVANANLEEANAFLSSISKKISRYIAPQIYESIFSGQKDVTIHTERKKLTIFFSDIKDFTSTTERMQPEELSSLLNEYFTEMSNIALRHGGTIDKFIGDAILVFFGDPQSRGTTGDARACVRMAVDMQRRLAELNVAWRDRGIEFPFGVRMGINTGFVNVGNFGSLDRMDYTIIGAEVNLSARLQAVAQPGTIVMSYETYALVRDIVAAHPLEPITMKGISRDVIPYMLDSLLDAAGKPVRVFEEHAQGLDFYFDPDRVDDAEAARVRRMLDDAIAELERRTGSRRDCVDGSTP